MNHDAASNPNYYTMPSGAQVIDITEWLSGSGAQAVQYIARATRIDGQIKGDRIGDLKKAAWFVQREIQRLEGDTHAG